MANSLTVKQLSTGTKNFAILYVGIPIADKISLNGGQVSKIAF